MELRRKLSEQLYSF